MSVMLGKRYKLIGSPHLAGVRKLVTLPVAIPIPLRMCSLDLRNI